jgi:hypothetical protein
MIRAIHAPTAYTVWTMSFVPHYGTEAVHQDPRSFRCRAFLQPYSEERKRST